MSNKLIDAFNSAGFKPKKAAEIGVYSVESSILRPYFGDINECHLFEAIPEFCRQIRSDTARYKNVEVHEIALADYNGSLDLCLAGSSTFSASQAVSPAINHDSFEKDKAELVTVQCRDFAEIDPGDLDFVSIDVEGGEFAILSRMKSRPKFISIETQARDYINPKLGSITDWMVENSYKVWMWNDTDTVFCRSPLVRQFLIERLKAVRHNYQYFAGRL